MVIFENGTAGSTMEQGDVVGPYKQYQVLTQCVKSPVMCIEDEFLLKATLVSCEEQAIHLQWQYNKGDDKQWQDAGDVENGAQSPLYRVKANRENLNSAWRVVVTVAT